MTRLLALLFVTGFVLSGCGPRIISGDGGAEAAVDGGGDAPIVANDGGPDGSVTCVGPNGQVLSPGQTASSGCTICVCQSNGTLACQPGGCIDTQVMCNAPDGRRLRPGESYSEPCRFCVCQSNGALTCQPQPCADGGPADGGTCHALTLAGAPAPMVTRLTSEPMTTGGAVTDGIYDLIEAGVYDPSGGSPPGMLGRVRVQILGGRTMHYVSEAGGMEMRGTFDMDLRGDALGLAAVCGGGSSASGRYTATPTSFLMVVPGGSVTVAFRFQRQR